MNFVIVEVDIDEISNCHSVCLCTLVAASFTYKLYLSTVINEFLLRFKLIQNSNVIDLKTHRKSQFFYCVLYAHTLLYGGVIKNTRIEWIQRIYIYKTKQLSVQKEFK